MDLPPERRRGSSRRDEVHERDHGVCALCGTDCDALLDAVRALRGWPEIQSDSLVALGYAPSDGIAERPLWQADHVIAVTMGGGGLGLENLRTLCLPCHRHETAKLAHVRAIRAKQPPKEQGSLF